MASKKVMPSDPAAASLSRGVHFRVKSQAPSSFVSFALCYRESTMDRSNGYEGVAAEFLAGRGGPRSAGVGATAVRNWARMLPRGSAVIDLGCGSGLPITAVLIAEGLNVYAWMRRRRWWMLFGATPLQDR